MKVNRELRDDGSVWKRYKTPTGVEVIVTSAFREIMKKGQANLINDGQEVPSSFLRLLHKYRTSYEGARHDEIRNFVASGMEASFYGVENSNIGMREEKNVGPNEDKIDRMDRIQHLLDLGSLPRWIQSPAHYGMLKIPKMQRGYYDKFIVMQKIDHGITAFDIIDGPRNDLIQASIIKEFGAIYGFHSLEDSQYKAFQQEILLKYREIRHKLEAAFSEHKKEFPGWTFSSLFADLFQRNILVTYNETPIGGSRLSFWIIDQ